MTSGSDRGFPDEMAWQTLAVTPNQVYRFGGWFAGGGYNTIAIRLRDGDITGPILKEEVVYTCDTDCTGFDWQEAYVSTPAVSGIMTAEWVLYGAGPGPDAENPVESSTHADGLTFVGVCYDPFADANGDGDVDQDDFAVVQDCYSGTDDFAPGCECFNRNADTVINQLDITAFEDCASGPGVPADVCCDGGDGCP
jgi:hypothetical protein